MIIHDGVVIFASSVDNYDKEKSGVKNNTVRIMTNEEEIQLMINSTKYISIHNAGDIKETFVRTIRDHTVYTVDGNNIHIFTWEAK